METTEPKAGRDEIIEGLRSTLTRPRAAAPRAWVVMLHDLGGDRGAAGGTFAQLASRLAERGFASLRFDFPGCGESPGAFADATVGRYAEAALAAIRFARAADGGLAHTGLLGYGFGGAIATACAHQLANIDALALWAPLGNPQADMTEALGDARVAEAERQGWTEVDLGGGKARLKRAFFDSLGDVSPIAALAPFTGDLFVAAGARDRMVKYVPLIYAAAGRARSVTPRTITGADHSLGANDLKPGGHLDWLIEETVAFFARAFRA